MERIMPMFVGLVSGCIIMVHMMFKELRNTFGKLMILYNVGVIGQCITSNSNTLYYHSTFNDALLSFLLFVYAIGSGC